MSNVFGKNFLVLIIPVSSSWSEIQPKMAKATFFKLQALLLGKGCCGTDNFGFWSGLNQGKDAQGSNITIFTVKNTYFLSKTDFARPSLY